MTTFVLVGGFWIGAWAWRGVAGRLASLGHEPLPLDLTGLGAKRALGRSDVSLETHVTDVVRFIEEENLRDVVLVGHSGGGAIVNEAAARVPGRVAGIVFVDGGPLPDGASIADFSGPGGRGELVRIAARIGAGWRIPLPAWDTFAPASLAGLDIAARAFFRAQAADQPLHVAIDPVRRNGRTVPADMPKWGVLCSMTRATVEGMIASGNPWFAPMGAPEWTLIELPTGHWPMLSEPDRLAELLAAWGAGGELAPRHHQRPEFALMREAG